ncbi:hypothetical protein BKA62DRAFT_681249 [Auriculariales sp. MPI-PUGE-AT-0066]|nr:hypothetical protein BKA62DRAFT_681249 [Auriculariales sp. MPI-PUGE-AT-0066]
MPKRKADSDEEESASYSEEEHPNPPRRRNRQKIPRQSKRRRKKSGMTKAKGDKAQEEESNGPVHSVDISSRRRLSLSKYKGNTFLDVRELYTKDGELKLGKKGITLKLEEVRVALSHLRHLRVLIHEQWKELVKHANTVEEWFNEE